MKAAKRKRAAASARAATAAVQDVAAVQADALVAECLAAEAAQAPVAAMPAAAIPEAKPAKAKAPVTASTMPVVTLNSNCTVKDAGALKHSLCAVLGSEAAVTLDVDGVERIDTAAMQVLCAFVMQRRADGRGVVWLGVPAALREAAGLLGVRELLTLPAEAAS